MREAIAARSAIVGIIGLGYVGLPLAAAVTRANFLTVGFDIDPGKVALLGAGKSYIDAVKSDYIAEIVKKKRFRATADFSELTTCDVIIMCVPTPLTKYREPDLSYVEDTTKTIARYLRPGQMIVLESTSFPGTTTQIVRPILERTGLKTGTEFFLGFSPEREDPGSSSHRTSTIPKVVSADGQQAKTLMEEFYGSVVSKIVPVSSPEVAEATKITENIFRAVNIALVNELKTIFASMGIDIWEVIDAAATKPFGYMPFYPGPGLGGHCIPIDPFYLTWKSREYERTTRFIELAGEINLSMPSYVIGKLEEALDKQLSVSLSNARVLFLGLAYKKNVADIRESPSFKLMKLLEHRGARADYYDPYVPEIPPTRDNPEFVGRRSVKFDSATLETYQAVVLVTDHDTIDYELVARHARLVIDTRNVFARRGFAGDYIVKA